MRSRLAARLAAVLLVLSGGRRIRLLWTLLATATVVGVMLGWVLVSGPIGRSDNALPIEVTPGPISPHNSETAPTIPQPRPPDTGRPQCFIAVFITRQTRSQADADRATLRGLIADVQLAESSSVPGWDSGQWVILAAREDEEQAESVVRSGLIAGYEGLVVQRC